MATGAATTADKPKRVRKAKLASSPCPNCQTGLIGAFCHACGQKAHLHDKLKHLIEELAEGIAHFDGRLWRTLPLLALNPGRLSREWMAGRRVRYVAPLHLFMFAVFLLFLVPNFTGRQMFDFERSPQDFFVVRSDGTRAYVDPRDTEGLKRELGLGGWAADAVELGGKLTKNPKYYGAKLETLSYKLSFMAVPISVAILWLMYAWRRRFSLYHHAVVSLYGLGFAVLLFSLASLFPPAVGSVLNTVIFTLAPIHAAVHLRGAYGSGWIQTIVRTVLLCVLTGTAFGGFLFGVAYLGLAS